METQHPTPNQEMPPLTPDAPPAMAAISQKDIEDVLGTLFAKIEEKRKTSDAYVDMFKASQGGLRGLLDDANDKIDDVIYNLYSILKEDFIPAALPEEEKQTIRNELYEQLALLPYMFRHVRRKIENEESYMCCADKTRQVIYEHFKELMRMPDEVSAPAKQEEQ